MMRVLSLSRFLQKAQSLANNLMSVGELCEMIVDAVISTGFTALFSLVFMVQIYIYAPTLLGLGFTCGFGISSVFLLFTAYLQMRVKRKQIRKTQRNKRHSLCTYNRYSENKSWLVRKKELFARWGPRSFPKMQRLHTIRRLCLKSTKR